MPSRLDTGLIDKTGWSRACYAGHHSTNINSKYICKNKSNKCTCDCHRDT